MVLSAHQPGLQIRSSGKRYSYILALGSNLDDRLAYLDAACQALQGLCDRNYPQKALLKSRIFETEPVGPGPQNHYLNICVRLETKFAPLELLQLCKEIEKRLGRKHRIRWACREIDIDILHCEGLEIRSETLTIPHPLIASRQFVLTPLCDLCPSLVLPGQQQSVASLLHGLIATEGKQFAKEFISSSQSNYALS